MNQFLVSDLFFFIMNRMKKKNVSLSEQFQNRIENNVETTPGLQERRNQET